MFHPVSTSSFSFAMPKLKEASTQWVDPMGISGFDHKLPFLKCLPPLIVLASNFCICWKTFSPKMFMITENLPQIPFPTGKVMFITMQMLLLSCCSSLPSCYAISLYF